MKRRAFLLLSTAAVFGADAWARAPVYPSVSNGQPLAFPRDYGAHPSYRTEWWYATGWLQTDAGTELGFQVTFFRSRPALDDANPSRFAPAQLLFADVALSDPGAGRLQHDQRAARGGFGLAGASEADTDVRIGDWSLQREAGGPAERYGRYRVIVAASDFTIAFTMQPRQPVLLNGAGGYSRKGPLESEASYYYSEPWLRVDGELTRRDRGNGSGSGKPERVRGDAWLDHEWSSALLADDALGWDWIGIDLDDGGAVMAFQIRDKAGRKFWAGGTLRGADGNARALSPDSISFTPLRWWRSPRTGTRYPVAMRVDAGDVHLALAPLMDDQELDSRATTGAVYWEGAVTARQVPNDGGAPKRLGRGYLELTGYFGRLDL
jgi:predicted secreted hydrolase